VNYAAETVSSLAQLFVPRSSQAQAEGDLDGLRKILVLGNRACAFIIFPITALLPILGKSIIEAWVGPKYVAASYPVLLILIFPVTLILAQVASGRTLLGMAKHRTWAYVALAEGAANLILSIILLRPYGIVGDTIGTAVPLTRSTIFFLPRHLCRLLGIKIRTYLCRAFSLPIMLCAPVVAVLFAHAPLVHSSSLARASDTSRDSGPGVRRRPALGILGGSSLGCTTFGCE